MWKELFEILLDADTNLADSVWDAGQLWVWVFEVSSDEELNDALANLNGIILAESWVFLDRSEDVTNAVNATGSELLLLLGLPLDCLKNLHKPWHEVVIVWLKVGIKNTCQATQSRQNFYL